MTKQTDYGIMVLTHLAQAEEGEVYTARGIASETGLSQPMISKVLKLLGEGGLLASQRGVNGGYQLTRTPQEISVADIIGALEGPVSMTECTDESAGDCRIETNCPVKGHWWTINQAILKTLNEISLAAMTRPMPKQLVNIRHEV